MDKINILIVEDNEDHLFFIKKALSNNDYNLQVITNGTEAYNYLLNPKIKPDVVLLDNHLPGMKGLEILKKLGPKTENYGFIVTTVDKDPEIIVDSMRAGALDFSPKTTEYFYILPQKIDKVYKILKDKLEKIETNANFKTIIESGGDDIWSIDTNYRLIALNQSFKDSMLALFKVPLKKGDCIKGVTAKEIDTFWIPKYDKVLAGEKLVFEFSPVNDNHVKCFEIRMNPIYIGDKIIGLSAIGRDITARKKQEQTKEVLFNIAKKANESLPLKKLFSFIHLELAKLLNVKNFYIGLVKEDKDWIRVPYMVDEEDSNYDFKKENSLSGYVIDTGKSLLIKNSERAAKKLLQQGPPSACWLGVPLIVAKKVIGVLVVQSYKDENTYKKADIHLLELIAANLSQFIKNAQDIDQVKSLNNKLQLAEKITQLGTYNLDFITNIFTCSDIVNKIIGIKPNDPMTLSAWENIVFPADVKENHNSVRQSVKTGKNFDLEYRILTHGKKELKWVHALGKIIYKNGKATNMVGTIQDITARKKIEIELFNKNQFLKKPLKLTPLAFIYFDTNSIVKIWNPSAERLFGYTAQEAIGKNIMDLIVPVNIHKDLKKVRDAVLNESGYNTYQNENVTKSGKHIICNWYNSEIKDENNKVIGLAALGQDVTRQTHLENTIKSIQKNISFKSGKDYYVTLAKELNKRLKSDYLVIGLYDKKTNTNTILSHLLKNKSLPNKTFDLKGTACAKVIKEGYFYLEKDLIKNFKVDKLLQKIKVNAYMGVPIYNSKNECVGSIGAMFCKPIADEETFKILLKFFAHKIASELERTALVETLVSKQKSLEAAEEIAKLGSFNLDLTTLKANCSKMFGKITGYNTKLPVDFHKDWRSIVHPDDVEGNKTALEKAKKTGKFNHTYRIKPKGSNKIKWLHGLGKITYKDHKATHFVGTIQDVTERKIAEEKLKESEEKFRAMYSDNHAVMLIINPKLGKIVEANQAACKFYGYSKDQLKGKKISDINTLSDEDLAYKIDLVKNEKKNYFNFKHKLANGQIRHVEVYSSPITLNTQTLLYSIIIDVTQRKLAEQALEISKKHLNLLYDNAPLSYQSLNEEGYLIDVNPAWLKTLDYKREEVINKHITTFLTPKSTKLFNERFPLFKASGILKNAVFEMIKKDGTLILTSVNGKIGKDASDNFKQTYCNFIDITKQKQAEQALKNSEKQFSMLMQQSPAVIEIYNLDGLQVSVNNAYEKLWGFSASTTVNKFNVLKSEEVKRSGLINYINSAYNGESVTVPEYQFDPTGATEAKGKGRTRWLSTKIYPLKDQANKVTNIVITHEDITERKLAEEKLKQSDVILNKIESIVKVFDDKGSVTYISPSVEAITGYTPQELLGHKWWRKTSFSLEEADEVLKAVLESIQKGIQPKQAIVQRSINTKNGKNVIIEWVNSKGIDNTFISVGIDVTERYEKELQFKKITETAHAAIVLANDKGLIIECNSATESIFGYAKKEILGQPIQILIPKKYKQAHENAFNAAIKNGNIKKIVSAKFEGVTKKGNIFPIEISLNHWQSNGRLVSCAFIYDISESQRQETLKEIIFNITKKANTAEPLETLFNYIKSELGRVINTKNFFIALYNEKSDMISTPYMVDEQDDNDDFPKGKTLTGYVIDTKTTLLANESVFKKLEKAKKIERHGPSSKCWLGVPLLVDNKAIGAMVVQSYTNQNAYTSKDVALLELIANSISQVIKQSEDFEQINLLSHALIQSTEAVVITDINGDIQYVNRAFTNLSGYSEKEAIGQNPRVLKSGEQPQEYYEKLWNTILSGQNWQGEFINKRKDGAKFLVLANISPIKNEKGIITHFLAVEEDITEKRKLEHDYLHAFIDAQEVEKQSFGEELHDGVSQILSAQSMFIDVLKTLTKGIKGKTAKYLDTVKQLNTQAINETRSIAHGLMSKQLKESGLIVAVEHICNDYSISRDINFSFSCKGLKEQEINAEIKSNIFRVIQEVATNTVRHSVAKKARVELSKTNNNQLKVVVKDNGIGIDFKRVKENKKGAGLENIKRRIKLLNGTIDLKTAPDEGTQYTFIIPLDNIQ